MKAVGSSRHGNRLPSEESGRRGMERFVVAEVPGYFDGPCARMSIGQFRFAFLFGHYFELIAGFHRSQANVLLQIVSLAGFHFQGQKAVVLGLGSRSNARLDPA